MAKSILHTAESRGHANHGWLNAHHSFSFANYYNPNRMNFGVLRVLNDDIVAAGMGFGMHPHDNMEIITIPLEGSLEHRDSMGNVGVINKGDIQVMSAGTGVRHSEYNPNKTLATKLLQIWVFPNKRQVAPRYEQLTLQTSDRKNKFQQIISPDLGDEGIWIYQDAWFHLADFEQGETQIYTLKKAGNGVYAFVIEGEVRINGTPLKRRDALGIWELESFSVEATTNTEFLFIEVPMNI